MTIEIEGLASDLRLLLPSVDVACLLEQPDSAKLERACAMCRSGLAQDAVLTQALSGLEASRLWCMDGAVTTKNAALVELEGSVASNYAYISQLGQAAQGNVDWAKNVRLELEAAEAWRFSLIDQAVLTTQTSALVSHLRLEESAASGYACIGQLGQVAQGNVDWAKNVRLELEAAEAWRFSLIDQAVLTTQTSALDSHLRLEESAASGYAYIGQLGQAAQESVDWAKNVRLELEAAEAWHFSLIDQAVLTTPTSALVAQLRLEESAASSYAYISQLGQAAQKAVDAATFVRLQLEKSESRHSSFIEEAMLMEANSSQVAQLELQESVASRYAYISQLGQAAQAANSLLGSQLEFEALKPAVITSSRRVERIDSQILDGWTRHIKDAGASSLMERAANLHIEPSDQAEAGNSDAQALAQQVREEFEEWESKLSVGYTGQLILLRQGGEPLVVRSLLVYEGQDGLLVQGTVSTEETTCYAHYAAFVFEFRAVRNDDLRSDRVLH